MEGAGGHGRGPESAGGSLSLGLAGVKELTQQAGGRGKATPLQHFPQTCNAPERGGPAGGWGAEDGVCSPRWRVNWYKLSGVDATIRCFH